MAQVIARWRTSERGILAELGTAVLSLAGLLTIALLIGRLPLKYTALTVTGAAALVSIILRPVVGLYLLAFTIPFGSLYPLNLGPLKLDASDILVALTAFSWFLRSTALRQDKLNGGWWLMALGLLLYSTLVGLLPAQNMTEALKEFIKWFEFGLVMVMVVHLVDVNHLDGIVAALLTAGALQGLLGIYQFISGSGPESFAFLGRFTRSFGTFEQPNPFGGYMGLLLPLAYGIVFTRWRDANAGHHRAEVGKQLMWWLALATGAIMLAALVMSGSRGALLGVGAGVMAVVLVTGKRLWPFLALVVFFVTAFGSTLIDLVPGAYLARVTDILAFSSITNLETIEITDANFSLIERAAHWLAAWRMFSLHPWLGVGLGQYSAVYPLVALPRWTNSLGHAHNYLLNTLAEGGIIGLVVYLLFQVTLLANALRVALARVRDTQWLGLAAIGLWSALFVHNMFDNLYVHYLQLIVALVFGLIIISVRQQHPAPGKETR